MTKMVLVPADVFAVLMSIVEKQPMVALYVRMKACEVTPDEEDHVDGPSLNGVHVEATA